MSEPGNINLKNRPRVQNDDGSVSTVRSMSFDEGGKEVLVPTVHDDGHIMSDKEAIQHYVQSGKHLGKFDSIDEANNYAQQLHNEQASMIARPMSERDQLIREKLDQMNYDPAQEKEKVDRFLKIIQQIESSGGKNFKHPEMESGIHAGQSAIGRYGLMPNTIQELNKRARMSGHQTPEMKDVAALQDPTQVKQLLEQQPQLEELYARQLAEKVLNKFPNEEEAAYSWNQGHNLTPEALQQRDYKNNPYVQKFRKLRQLIASK